MDENIKKLLKENKKLQQKVVSSLVWSDSMRTTISLGRRSVSMTLRSFAVISQFAGGPVTQTIGQSFRMAFNQSFCRSAWILARVNSGRLGPRRWTPLRPMDLVLIPEAEWHIRIAQLPTRPTLRQPEMTLFANRSIIIILAPDSIRLVTKFHIHSISVPHISHCCYSLSLFYVPWRLVGCNPINRWAPYLKRMYQHEEIVLHVETWVYSRPPPKQLFHFQKWLLNSIPRSRARGWEAQIWRDYATQFRFLYSVSFCLHAHEHKFRNH